MKRQWNWRIWAGFAVAMGAGLSYIPLFVRFAVTRDFPWANLLLFAIGGYLLASGLRKAFGEPVAYRGKVAGSILAALSLALFALFAAGTYLAARSLPSAATALRVGQAAPDFHLSDIAGHTVTLSGLRQDHRAVLLIFYRGYW